MLSFFMLLRVNDLYKLSINIYIYDIDLWYNNAGLEKGFKQAKAKRDPFIL